MVDPISRRLALGLLLAGTLARPRPHPAITEGLARATPGSRPASPLPQSLGSTDLRATQTHRGPTRKDGTLWSSYIAGHAPGAAFDLQYNLGRTFSLVLGVQVFAKVGGHLRGAGAAPVLLLRLRNVSGTRRTWAFRSRPSR